MELDDEVIALSGNGDLLAVLGRRSVAIFEAGGRRSAQSDLARLLEGVRPVPRRPVGRIVTVGPEEWEIWSTFLGERDVFRLRLQEGSAVLEPAGAEPPEAPVLGIERGWPGSVIEVEALPALFHLEADGHLVAEPAGVRTSEPVGEPLAAAFSDGDWKIYVSAPSIPGEPDRLMEYAWIGSELRRMRVSRPFQGRIAALLLDEDDAVIALVDRPRHSRLIRETAADLWSPEPP